ncbi:MAG: oligoendopeptidase F [Victivallales bacterium]|jgi:oligoendopeptidase F|nr:oligoendopeptidase F [Victivallales bacterium]
MKISANQTWDLKAIYPDAQAWEKDFNRIKPLADAFLAFRGKLSDGALTLKQAIEALDEFERLGEKVYTYAHLLSDENTADNSNRARVDRVEGLFASLAENSAWFDPEIMAIPEELMQRYLDDPALTLYRRSLLELLREKPHTLTEPEERLLGTLGDVLSNPSKTFEILNDADLIFGKIKGESGKSKLLTHGNYRRFLESPDRDVRKRAFSKMFSTYSKFRNTFASTLDGVVKTHVAGAKIRHYNSALEQALFSDHIPQEVYRNLILAVHGKLDAFYDYMKLRREVMNLPKLDMYDMYNPLIPACRKEYTFAEAVELVKNALAPLGKEYAEHLDLAFTQRWVDVPERKGKRSGAYSSGCYDTFPYLLLNYNGTLNDVFTLAHELGHSMHSFYSNRTQHYHYASYSIFVAEVASTTNEMLLFDYLLKHTGDRDFRCYLLGHLADEIRGTIYRQTMFAEFELLMHELAEQSIPLTADTLNTKYYELNKLYYGPEVEADRKIAVEWSRIPHFYYNFYVYKYATGMSAAVKLSENLLSLDPDKREAYFGFLKAGDSKDVLDIMRDAGVDLSTPAPVEAALDYFGDTVKKLRAELGR